MNKFLAILISVFAFSCSSNSKKVNDPIDVLDENPPSMGFNTEASDPEAIMIADKVMQAMGGRRAWDETRYIGWTFFGRRNLLWDKFTGDVRIDIIGEDERYLLNVHSLEGQVYRNGENVSNPDSLASYLKRGKSIWINDSYWLIMPFKMKDSGVSLFYTGSDTTQMGVESYKLQLAFNNVGDTPENIYDVWVDMETNFVTQWGYYESSENVVPNFITPWKDYKKMGNILLSGDRGKHQLTNIKVLEEVSPMTFTSLKQLNY